MRLLFDMDRQDYGECTHTFTRNSARSIIIRSGKIIEKDDMLSVK